MHKQEALALLKSRMKDIPCSDTSSTVVLYQYLSGFPSILHVSATENEAVRSIIDRTPEASPVHNGQLDDNIFPYGFTTFCYALDGDMELLVSVPGGRANARGSYYHKVQLRRRQTRLVPEDNNIRAALRIRGEHRDLLPAMAGIVAVEGDFVVIVPGEFIQNGWQISDEEVLKRLRTLQVYFEKQWASDTHIVFRVPPAQKDETSRTGKTRSFHTMFPRNVIAGYADDIFVASLCVTEENSSLTITEYSERGKTIKKEHTSYFPGREAFLKGEPFRFGSLKMIIDLYEKFMRSEEADEATALAAAYLGGEG